MPELVHLLPGLEELRQGGAVHFGASPVRAEYFEPAFLFERAHHVQRVLLVRQLRGFVSNGFVGDVFDVIVLSRRVETCLRTFFERPVKPGGKTRRPNQPRRVFDECVIVQNTQHFGFNISRAVKGIHEQAARTRIERQGHRVDREIAALQVFDNGGWRHLRRFAGFLIALGPRHADFRPHVAWQSQQQAFQVVIVAHDGHARPFQLLLQLERIALHRKIEVANGKAADDVADRTACQVDIHAGRARNVLDQGDATLLVRRQPDFHRVNVVSHAL